MSMIKKEAEGHVESAEKTPAHEQVYQRIRQLILFGEMAPGQSVTIQGLTDRLNVGMTPVREAIRRLISEGALKFQGNRRVSVPVLSDKDVSQLIFARKTIESQLTRIAANKIKRTEITMLTSIDEELDHAIETGNISGYLAANYRFHQALYNIAEAPILAEIADRLWLRFGPSLRVVCGRFGTQNLPDLHKEMLSALNRNDVEATVRSLEQDVEQGMEMMVAVLEGNGG